MTGRVSHPSPRRTTAPGRGRATTWLLSVGLLLWAFWACLILSSPVHRVGLATLQQALNQHRVMQWLPVESRDSGGGLPQRFTPGLADPLAQEYEPADVFLMTGAGGGQVGSRASAPTAVQILWSDGDGLHVTDDFTVDQDWRIDASGLPVAASSPSAAAYRALLSTPGPQQVGDVGSLLPFGGLSVGGGNTSVDVVTMLGIAGSVAALATLVTFPTRFRTRWSWFWILACPMGLGVVWYVMREGWFGREPAPAARRSGAEGFGVFVGISLVVGTLVDFWLQRPR